MTNLIYLTDEGAHTWTDTGGDDTLDLGGLAADAVRVGDQWDLGAADRARLFKWKLNIDGFDTAPVVGETIDVYLAFSDGTNQDGNVGTVDAAGVVASLPNLLFLGSAVVQTTTAGDNVITGGRVLIEERYVSPVIHNNTADALLSTSDSHKFILQAVPDEIQDAP